MKSKTALKVLTFIIGLLAGGSLWAQPYGNEWISQVQTYYKIKVVEEGIFRLTYQSLIEAGVPLATIDARRLQIFHRGVEQAIHLPGQEDGRFNSGDYIEFYGQPTDGRPDTELYVNAKAQPHTYYNLFSDSAAYFLTWPLTATFGKRMPAPQPESNVSNLPTESYHLREVLKLQTSSYSQGKTYYGGDIILSQYDVGEGWTGTDIAKGGRQALKLTGLNGAVTAGPNPQLEVLLVGRNNLLHRVEVYAGPAEGRVRLLKTVEFSEHDPYLVSLPLEWADISENGELFVVTSVLGFSNSADRAAVSYSKVTYASSFDMQRGSLKKFWLKTNAGGKSLIKVTNLIKAGQLFDITNPDAPAKIGVTPSISEFTAIVNNTNTRRTLLVTTTPLVPSSLKKVSMPTIDAAAYNYIIITHEKLRRPTTSGRPDPVADYKSYRESIAGGGHKVLLLEIDEVFNLFNYGEISHSAITRLAAFLLAKGKPEFFFLIGKGTGVHRGYYRQNSSTTSLIHFVPTHGTPGSDVALLTRSGGESPIAVGRLNARNSDDVEAYFHKVLEMEGQKFDKMWRKNFIHLSGGTNQAELQQFKSNVDRFKSIAEGTYLGGRVVTSSKSTSNTVEFINISEEVNKGVAMITFFGHSASFSTDIDIGQVSNPVFGYSNKGRYPVIIVNGCVTGNIFETEFTFGEDWIQTPDLGALGFIAHSYKGFSSDLKEYTTLFYETAFADTAFINQPLGKVKHEVGIKYSYRNGISQRNTAQIQQMILQGDPAIRIFGAGKPDFEITEENVEVIDVEGNPLKTAKDTFSLKVPVRNFGINAGRKPLDIIVRRRASDGSVKVDSLRKENLLREDTLYFGISNPGLSGLGDISFEILLDPNNEIDELNELNNSVSLDIFLALGTVINVRPLNRGIAGAEVDLVVQSTDLLSLKRGIVIEIDTSRSFISPFKKRITGEMRVVTRQHVNLEDAGPLPDSTVIYWRSRFLELGAEEDTAWVRSQFTMIKEGSPGFSLVSANQFADTEIKGMALSKKTFSWTFPENKTEVAVTTFGPLNPGTANRDFSVKVGTTELFIETNGFNMCRNNTFNAVVFDKQSTVPYVPFLEWQRYNVRLTCGVEPKRIHNFTDLEVNDPDQAGGGTRRLSQFLNAVSNGDYVVFFNIESVKYSQWDAEVKELLKNFGIKSSTLNNLQDGQPVIFFGKKGSSEGSAIEILSDGSTKPLNEHQLRLEDVVTGRFFSGSVTSKRIGPARRWESISQKVKLAPEHSAVNYSLDIYGMKPGGAADLLIANSSNLNLDLSFIDAKVYPYLQLKYSTTDQNTLTPVQLREWIVKFIPTPEGILLTSDPVAWKKQTKSLFIGQQITVPYTYFNVSKQDFKDTLQVAYELQSNRNDILGKGKLQLPPLAAGDSVQFSVQMSTDGKVGMSSLRTLVGTGEVESISNNNLLTFRDYLNISGDHENPQLDVTFDGTYILNGDIVSPNPLIKMRLFDEFKYKQKKDTVGIDIYLKAACDECDFQRIPFSGGRMTWTANAEKGEFDIEYRPGPLEDGLWTLRVTAADAAGNQAGTAPYEVNFEVINESSVTNLYPYPNPFSSSTRFVFTLTGAEVPDQFKIQIMTVSGRVVREITRDEIGFMRIGNNITRYAWNGTDEFGDQLANGVYLYRVMMTLNGQPIKHRATSADKAFKNGFGKLYLLR